LYLVFIGVPLCTIIALGVATLLSAEIPGKGIMRTLVYIPSVIPPVAVALVWMWILNPNYGLINYILDIFHIKGPGWLADPNWSKPAIMLMILWTTGNVIVLYLAALKDVAVELYEAAQLDGANKFKIFIKITLPSISNVIFYNVITGIIAFSQFFTQAYVVTSSSGIQGLGTPNNSTLFFGLYLYQNAFGFLKMGFASAMGWVLLIFSLIATWVLLRYSDTFQ
jgi:multiple sugar transport system permease protein